MTCDKTEKVSLMIDGELPVSERQTTQQHLIECAECQQAWEDFLGLRSQMVAYRAQLEPSAAGLALAKIISQQPPEYPTAPAITANRRTQFSSRFSFASFNPRLAAVAALLVIALTIGGIAFLRQRSPADLSSNNTAPPEKQESSRPDNSSSLNIPSDLTAQAKPKSTKNGPIEGRRPRSIDKRGSKPRERSAPTWQPRPQPGPPPTYAVVEEDLVSPGRYGDGEILTARHLQQSEVLLRAFRNIRVDRAGSAPEISYERRRARQLLYRNIHLRREADHSGDVQVASLLEALEPILLDIANLGDRPEGDEVRAIRDRVERKNLVPLLQVNSTAVARAYE